MLVYLILQKLIIETGPYVLQRFDDRVPNVQSVWHPLHEASELMFSFSPDSVETVHPDGNGLLPVGTDQE